MDSARVTVFLPRKYAKFLKILKTRGVNKSTVVQKALSILYQKMNIKITDGKGRPKNDDKVIDNFFGVN